MATSNLHEAKTRSEEGDLAEITLGKYLASARVKAGLSLREVEASTGKEVSNAYLSQLEKDKIAKPSPNMLHALATVYGMPYETLMQYAGYISPENQERTVTRIRSTSAFVIENVTPDEQVELLKYLEFVRFSKKRL